MPKKLGLLPKRRHRTDAPSEHVARVGWLLLRLLHDRVAEYATYCDRFGCSTRVFQRDLSKLREIGRGYFTISRMRGGRVLIAVAAGRLSALNSQSRSLTETLSRIAAALGGPVGREVQNAAGQRNEQNASGFLHAREPLPAANERIIRIYDFLQNAAAGPARVEFRYTSRGKQTSRRVEPYHVMARSGRYYLVAYDLVRKDWRNFGLDAIDEASLRKEGTFSPRSVPDRLLAHRAVGWISGSNTLDVTVYVSAVVAGSVAARNWQSGQRLVSLETGAAEITLTVDDPAEAVRWALQFGAEAVIVAPPQVVALAREVVAEIGRSYAASVRPRSVAG